jgi:hypothetical protein
LEFKTKLLFYGDLLFFISVANLGDIFSLLPIVLDPKIFALVCIDWPALFYLIFFELVAFAGLTPCKKDSCLSNYN